MKELNKLLANNLEYFDSKEFEDKYCYEGTLGYNYSKEKTSFKVWTPVASKVWLNLYSEDMGENLIQRYDMNEAGQGVWELEIECDLEDKYYTYGVRVDNLCKVTDKEELSSIDYKYTLEESFVEFEAADIYGKACGANGLRTMIVDMAKTNPEGWADDIKPEISSPLDTILYEVHVRDFSSDESSGSSCPKKYVAFTEKGTKNSFGLSTGLDHLKELGVTHVHLLPMQDYATVDEIEKDPERYNWGYDPLNYFIPEGSYATDAHDGKVRIREFKELVQALHKQGIRVVMDVVYNHTYDVVNSLYNKLVPNYYHRIEDGKYTDGSACGNETASDHKMFAKYMIDSLKYWLKEYHIDGFRFDLMAVHDIETMNKIRKMADEVCDSIILYGEGWKGGYSKLSPFKAAFKLNAKKLDNIAMFNDDGRDAVKGSVFDAPIKGFATGAMYDNSVSNKEAIVNRVKFMIAGSCEHDQVEHIDGVENPMYKLEDDVIFWADKSSKSINYVSAHDNLTLWDKILVSNTSETLETKKKMNKLSMAAVMLSQGIPFIHAGDEFLRSKVNPKCGLGYDDNSYMSCDKVNSIKWDEKHTFKDVYDYYRGLIEYRKYAKELKLDEASDIRRLVRFSDTTQEAVIVYTIGENKEMLVALNGNNKDYKLQLPEGNWDVYIDDSIAGDKVLRTEKESVMVKALSAIVLRRSL